MMLASCLGVATWALGLDRYAVTPLALIMLFSHYTLARRWVTAVLVIRILTHPLWTDYLLLALLATRPWLSFEMRAIFPAFLIPDWVAWVDWHDNKTGFSVAFGVGIFLYGNLLFQIASDFIRGRADTAFIMANYIAYICLCGWFASVTVK